MGFKLKSITKAVTSVVKSVVKTVTKVAVGIATGEYILKGIGAIVNFVGNEVLDDALGLDKLGSELAQVGTDIKQVGKVLGGDYHDDMKELQYMQNQLQNRISNYNGDVDALSDKVSSLIAFHEIFQLAASNRLDMYVDEYGPQLESAVAELKRAMAQLESEYDFVIGLTQGAFLQKIIGSIIMIIGGIASDVEDIAAGKADGDTFKRVISAIIMIVIVILLVLAGPVGWMAITGVVLSAVAVFMALDGMYANGAATGAIMSCFDFLFNDVLNLDDVIGSDFNKFDKDHEDYAEMVMFTKIAFALTGAGLSWASSAGNYAAAAQYGTEAWSQQTAMLAVQDAGLVAESSAAAIATTVSDFFGIDISSFSSIYDAYSAASKVGDVLNEKKAYDAMVDKFREEGLKLESAIDSKYRKNFMKHYKDTAYFLQDQQENIDRYVWSMGAQNMYVDPYGTTPVANIRFEPDKDTRVMAFGYEEMFDENKVAGSKNYFNSILYG